MSLAEDVKRCAADVNSELGPHLREHAYQEALQVALTGEGVQYTTEATIPVMFRGFPVARMHPDLIVGDVYRLILELKVGSDGTDQLRSYIDYADRIGLDDVDGGLMISFGEDLEVNEIWDA